MTPGIAGKFYVGAWSEGGSDYPLSRHKFIALLKKLKVPPLNAPNGSYFHRRTAADRLNYSILQRGITKANLPRAAKAQVVRSAKNDSDNHSLGGPVCHKSFRANTKQ